jgi:hypothetical protein
VDQSYAGAEMVLRWKLPEDAEMLLTRRFQIINAWRPIKTVFKDPLAVADANSVAESDLVAAGIVYPTRRGETWTVKANPNHRWYFKHEQGPDEVMLVKCYDSVESVARRTPHTAFEKPHEGDTGSRESIEVRALVLYQS